MADNLAMNCGWGPKRRSRKPPHTHDYVSPKVLAALRELLGPSGRVADLGAGNGALAGLLASSGYDTVGIEADERGVEIARNHYPDIPFHGFSVYDDPAALLDVEGTFDAVVSTEVIEHLYFPHLLVTYAKAILKPGGVFILTTPYHGYLKDLALAIAGRWDSHHTALWHGGHIKFWSRKTLSTLLDRNGFSVVDFQGLGRCPYMWKSMMLVARPSEA